MPLVVSMDHKKRSAQELADFMDQRYDCSCVSPSEYGHNPLCPYEQIRQLLYSFIGAQSLNKAGKNDRQS